MLNTLCPHLAKPVPLIYPLEHRIDRPYVGMGIGVYDVMGGGRGGAAPHEAPRQAQDDGVVPVGQGHRDPRRDPLLRGPGRRRPAHHDAGAHRRAVRRAVRQQHPGRSASCARATASSACGPRTSRAAREFDIRATQVINAAGVWTDEIQEMVGGRGQFRVRASKGVHIVVPRNRINSATGIIARTAKSVLFIVPWGSHWIVGTTDTDWELDLAHPAASRSRHRLPARAGQPAARRPAHPRRRRRRLRRAAAAAGRRVRLDQQALARARRRRARCAGSP